MEWDSRKSWCSASQGAVELGRESVEMGDWEVDENGIAGGIEKLKDADTPGHGEKYQIPLSW